MPTHSTAVTVGMVEMVQPPETLAMPLILAMLLVKMLLPRVRVASKQGRARVVVAWLRVFPATTE